jgi:hypothetical protein
MPFCISLLYCAIICLFGGGLLKILFEEVGFQMFSEDEQDVLASGGSWVHHWGTRTEKSLDWDERELTNHEQNILRHSPT